MAISITSQRSTEKRSLLLDTDVVKTHVSNVNNGAANLRGLYIDNVNGSAKNWLKLYDSDGSDLATAKPVIGIPVANTKIVSVILGDGLTLTDGLSYAGSDADGDDLTNDPAGTMKLAACFSDS